MAEVAAVPGGGEAWAAGIESGGSDAAGAGPHPRPTRRSAAAAMTMIRRSSSAAAGTRRFDCVCFLGPRALENPFRAWGKPAWLRLVTS